MMKKTKIIGTASLIMIVLFASLQACSDDYDNHYTENNTQAQRTTLMQLIEQQPNLSVFADMLKATEYGVVLSGNQSYTVFAPTNDALANFDTTNHAAVLNTVKTHIARYIHNVSSNTLKSIKMVNAKLIPCQGNVGTIGSQNFLRTNIEAKNGILHIVEGIIPFQRNIWEYMELQGFDSIYNYMYSFNIKRFDRNNSKELGYEGGFPKYDSVFVESNIMWEYTSRSDKGVGFLNHEDSLYTMILPTNAAWTEAYDRIKPYFVNNALVGSDSLQHVNTQYAIVQNLVFRGPIDNPANLSAEDSLISTRRSVFYDPAHLFGNAQQQKTSNGLVYTTNQLTYKAWETWQQPIKVEAENSYGRAANEAQVSGVILRRPSDPGVSDYFIEVEPIGSSSMPEVYFSIPNTLSGEYNIYAVFVPAYYVFPASTSEETRIRFRVQQLDRTTANDVVPKWINIQSGGNPLPNEDMRTPPDALTSATDVKKMLLASNFRLPYANYGETVTTLRLSVLSRLLRGDENRANRMFIDYVIFEPVIPVTE
jgi:uncharacterized surface protein with fasciclin (FAS1) repeats